MTTTDIATQFEILSQAHRYSDAANRKDAALFRSLWADESRWVIGPPINKEFNSAADITQAFVHLLDSWEFFVQMTSSFHIHANGDTATAHFYVNEIARSKGGESNYNLSLYKDKLVKKDGVWLFVERIYEVIYLDQSPLRGAAFALS